MVDNLLKIFKMSQLDLKAHTFVKLVKHGYSPVWGNGYVYAKGEIPILLVAHLDTVHKTLPEEIYYDKEKDVLWSPDGIGGDDRCGVWTILEIIKKYKPHVLFTEDEEIGCIGAGKAVQELKKPDVRFIIEIDRRGSDDCVFYQCNNKDFHKYIESFGFVSAWGSFSDIVELSDAWDIASVNLSSGYYNEHTLQEIVKLKETIHTRDRIIKILEDEDKTYYSYDKKTYKTYYSQNYGSQTYIDWYDDYGYIDQDGKYHFYGEEDEDDENEGFV